MIDPAEIESYNDWKSRKISGAIDLSIQAYNAEMEAVAVAWDEGAAVGLRSAPDSLDAIQAKNPYRADGMKGARPSGTAPIPELPTPEPVSGNQEEQLPAGAGPGENPVADAQRAFGVTP